MAWRLGDRECRYEGCNPEVSKQIDAPKFLDFATVLEYREAARSQSLKL